MKDRRTEKGWIEKLNDRQTEKQQERKEGRRTDRMVKKYK